MAKTGGRRASQSKPPAQRGRDNLAIDGQRLWDSLMEMARIGATPKGGVCRLALTDLDRESRDLFGDWCRAAGCSVTVDRMGSMFARRAGADDSLPPVLVGSHLDSQPTGGKFDGALGVLAALELVRTLNDLGLQTRHPIEIVAWTNEEGARFSPAMTASGVFAGAIALDFARAIADRDGHSMGAELDRIGYSGPAPVGGRPVHAFFELHIEQGPILEEDGIDIGVVTAAQGQRWYEITFTGQDSHAGTTPMERRRDALLGAARTVELVHKIGMDHFPDGRATCGVLTVQPASPNVIPGRAFLTAEFRNPDAKALDAMDRALRTQLPRIAAGQKLELELAQVNEFPPQPFDARCIAAVRHAADKLGLTHKPVISGAGHDAVYMARVAPTAMVFVPCVGGISHNESEDCKPEWVRNGANVLLHAVLEAAGIIGAGR